MSAASAARAVSHPNRQVVPIAELAAFQTELLSWFDDSKRELDWRTTRDPYRVWVSEIMLQQTRVATVIPYYRRFLASFPTIHLLAKARSDVVLRHWAGLGYYSRARNLHRAAKEIVARHAGKFPRSLQVALQLPGIGEYTAAAVLSIAYGLPHAVLDGNVARVLARLGAIRGDLRRPSRWHALGRSANELLATQAAGDWNQAMMELCATICTPRAPQCTKCPVSRWCRVHTLGIALRVPAIRRKRRSIRVVISAAVLLDPRGRTLLVSNEGEHSLLFSGLWHFPAVRSAKPAREKLARYLRECFGLSTQLEPLRTARHTVTFRRIVLAPFLARVPKLPRASGARKPSLTNLERIAVSSATKKIASAAKAALRA